MRTACVTNFCPFYRRALFRILAQRVGAEFFFFSDASESNWENRNPRGDDALPAVSLHHPPILPGAVLLRVARGLSSGRYDCVIQGVSGRYVVPLTYCVAKLRRIPFVAWTGFWNHPRTLFHRLTFPLIRHIYRHADAVVVYGTHVRDYIASLGVPPERIFIAWNTADNAAYNRVVAPADAGALRRELAPDGMPLVLFVGRLSEEKGVGVLLDAAALWEKRGTRASLVIIGRGPEKAALEDRVRRLDLTRVTFLDYVDNAELYRYYHVADVLAVPSVTTRVFKEPWGLVVNEAMNQGCPVVASDAVGAAMGGLLDDGTTGFVVDEGNASALSVAVEKVLEDNALRERMRVAARARIGKWTYDRMAKGFIDAVAAATHSSREYTANDSVSS